MITIKGIAHFQLTVNDLQAAMPFYEKIFSFMGMIPTVKAPNGLYMIGGQTAIGITRSDDTHRDDQFDRRRVGLHHLCLRATSRADIDALHVFLLENDVHVVYPPQESDVAPGYYSVLFEDLEGIRIEVNYVPEKGHFVDVSKLPLKTMPGFEDYPS